MGRATGTGGHRYRLQRCGAVHPVVWVLDLYLVSGARAPVKPVTRRREPAGRGGGYGGTGDLIAGKAQLTGPDTVDIQLDGRIIQRRGDLKIPEFADSRQFLQQLLRRLFALIEIAVGHGNLYRIVAAEVEYLLHDVPRFEGYFGGRHRPGHRRPQFFAKIGDVDDAGLQSDLRDRFVGPARPQVDIVNGIAGRLRADKGGTDLQIGRAHV